MPETDHRWVDASGRVWAATTCSGTTAGSTSSPRCPAPRPPATSRLWRSECDGHGRATGEVGRNWCIWSRWTSGS